MTTLLERINSEVEKLLPPTAIPQLINNIWDETVTSIIAQLKANKPTVDIDKLFNIPEVRSAIYLAFVIGLLVRTLGVEELRRKVLGPDSELAPAPSEQAEF